MASFFLPSPSPAVSRHPFSKAYLQHSQTAIQPCMWFIEEPSQFSVGLTCSILEKPPTGLHDCLRMLQACFRKRMSGSKPPPSSLIFCSPRWPRLTDRDLGGVIQHHSELSQLSSHSRIDLPICRGKLNLSSSLTCAYKTKLFMLSVFSRRIYNVRRCLGL